MYEGEKVDVIVDVWCEAPVQRLWKEFADSALTKEDRRTKWDRLEYWHNAKEYTDDIERQILKAMTHPRCVGWGEMGLDYHYDNSPREIQRQVFARQLRHAVRLGKSLTIPTREADDDTERILKELFPRIIGSISTALPTPQNSHFPNLYIGITGVITFTTNLNTAQVIRQMNPQPSTPSDLRILLETDAPYMVPASIYASLSSLSGHRLLLSRSAMIPWTSDFVLGVLKEKEGEADGWDSMKVSEAERENARKVYGV
ncbi:hypothetical protein PM082_014740 [Marasmius tenuissimus]|nr:hypothetical protein PM082_014740 [Marasmius tenuissimus]